LTALPRKRGIETGLLLWLISLGGSLAELIRLCESAANLTPVNNPRHSPKRA
jgi:hypothetical protein